MKRYTADFLRERITEADFQNWKHNPVTKLVLRYHADVEQQWAEHQIAAMRNSAGALPDFLQGEFKGVINTRKQCAEITYQEIVEFYPADEPPEEEQS